MSLIACLGSMLLFHLKMDDSYFLDVNPGGTLVVRRCYNFAKLSTTTGDFLE